MKKLEGRVAIVTGAGGGIGKAIALRLAAEGAKVVVACRKDSGDSVNEIRAAGGEAEFIATDVTDEEAVKNLVARTVADFGRLDILVNNAGIFGLEHCRIAELETSIWDSILDVNLKGTFLCTKYAVPELLKSPCANVINIASPAGLDFNPLTAYAASKAGVIAMTRTVALQYPGRIRVNAIVPGSTDTPGRAESRILRNIDPHAQITSFNSQLVQREGKPEDIANFIAYVVSDEGSFIDAAVLRADGGYVAPGPKPAYVEEMRKLEEEYR